MLVPYFLGSMLEIFRKKKVWPKNFQLLPQSKVAIVLAYLVLRQRSGETNWRGKTSVGCWWVGHGITSGKHPCECRNFCREIFTRKSLARTWLFHKDHFWKQLFFSDFKHQDVLCFFWFQLCFIVVAFQNHFIINPCRFPRHDSEIPIFHFPPVVLPTDFRRISQSSPQLPPSSDPLKRLPFARCLAFDSIQTTGSLETQGEDFAVKGRWVGLGGRGTCSNGFLLGLEIFWSQNNKSVVRFWWFIFCFGRSWIFFFATPTSLEGGKNDYFEWVYSSNKLYLKK